MGFYDCRKILKLQKSRTSENCESFKSPVPPRRYKKVMFFFRQYTKINIISDRILDRISESLLDSGQDQGQTKLQVAW